jgi:hypothetical protein
MPDTQRGALTADSAEVIDILLAQTEAAQRGALTVWTIYDRPKDYPHATVARKHEVASGVSVPGDHLLIADLEFLRECFRAAGLVLVPRADDDDVKIVESWV